MVKIEVISEAMAIVETAKGSAGERLRDALQKLESMVPGVALRIAPEDGVVPLERYKAAYKRAAAAKGMLVKIRIANDMLYVMHGQEEPEDPDLNEPGVGGTNPESAPPSEGQVSEPLDPESNSRADESLERTREGLDAALQEGCPFSSEPHGHDEGGKCLLPEESA